MTAVRERSIARRVTVLHEGRVMAQGTHGELMALGGRYRRFVELQTRGAA